MAVATECKPAVLPLAGGRAGASVRIHPILTGEMLAPVSFVHRHMGALSGLKTARDLLGRTPLRFAAPRWVWLPIPAFLIEHPTAGAILIDTGLHASCANSVAGNMGRAGALMYVVRMGHDQALRFQLPHRGVPTAEVSYVVMTHLHIDHASAVSDFPQATFLVDQREWNAAAEGGLMKGYHPRQFDHAFDWRGVDYTSDEVESFAGFARSLDLLGDGTVRVLSTPGHSPGHQSVVVRTGDGEVLLTGDAAYTERALHDGAKPFLIDDDHLYRRSIKEILGYLDQTPDAVVITGHDWELWPRLKAVYG